MSLKKALVQALCFAMLALFDFAVADPATPKVGVNLYLDAMQSLAEGHYKEARELLQRLTASEPHHAGAWLDLAILQCALGNTQEAEALFSAVENRFSPPPVILEVIAQQRAKGCGARQTEGPFVRLRLGYGVDSNVNQGARNLNFSIGRGPSAINLVLLPEYAAKKDNFTELSAEFVQSLPKTAALVFVQLQDKEYSRLSKFDLGSLTTGLDYPWKVGNWELRSTGSLGFITIGRSLYQRTGQLQLQVAPPLKMPIGWELGAIAAGTKIAYQTIEYFDSMLWESRGMLTYRSPDVFFQGSIGYAYDVGSDLRPGGNRQGTTTSLIGRKRLFGNVVGELNLTYQHWRGEQAYSLGLVDERRNQTTQLLRASIVVPITPQNALFIEFRDVRNQENISLFEYRGKIMQISWQWQN